MFLASTQGLLAYSASYSSTMLTVAEKTSIRLQRYSVCVSGELIKSSLSFSFSCLPPAVAIYFAGIRSEAQHLKFPTQTLYLGNSTSNTASLILLLRNGTMLMLASAQINGHLNPNEGPWNNPVFVLSPPFILITINRHPSSWRGNREYDSLEYYVISQHYTSDFITATTTI